jgi:polyhydroxyalkanoate synthase subunit PhaC
MAKGRSKTGLTLDDAKAHGFDQSQTISETSKPSKKKAKKKSIKLKVSGADPSSKASQRDPTTDKPPPQPQEDSLMRLLRAQNLESLEALTKGLGEAATKLSGVSAKVVKDAVSETARPFQPDPYGLAPYATDVAKRLAGDADKVMAAQQALWAGYAQIWTDAIKTMMGEATDDVVIAPKDKRFADPDWQNIPMFNLLQKTYLHTANWFNSLVDQVDGIDDMTRRKASFFTKQLADAFAPTNFLMTNPVALREALRTGGQSLVQGIANLEADLERGKGRLTPSQVDERPFRIGENIAVSPGKVIWRGEILEIIQYNPTTKSVFETPILFFPPWINKFYILDMRQDNSMVKWLTEQGHTVFVVSWLNPDASHAEKTFEDYSRLGIHEALDAVYQATGVRQINTVGYCIGGTLLATTMAEMAKTGDDRVKSATFFASQSDFEEAGDLKVFTDDAALQYIQGEIEHSGGVLDAVIMGETFNFLRANDLVWSFVVNNYLMGRDPKPFDLLFWNADQTRMPRDLHLFYLTNFYRQNKLAKGEMIMNGHLLDMSEITTPIYMQSSKEDHIAPWRSIYRGARLYGGPVRMILAGSGHIAGVINHPDAVKYNHYLPSDDLTALPATADAWLVGLTEHKGSWWPDWAKWLAVRSGPQVAARVPGSGELAPICDAPGTYVLVK